MIISAEITSSDLSLEDIEGKCRSKYFDIDTSSMEQDGWKDSEYRVELSMNSILPNADSNSYSKAVTIDAMDSDGLVIHKNKTVWINFIPTI